jgi:hypothetical protein
MKKLIMLSLITYTLSFTNAVAQGAWSPRSPMPNDSAIFQGISFSIGNYGYAGIGETNFGTYPVELWQFDPSTNSWSRKADFPGTARVSPATFVIGTKAYVATGVTRNEGTCLNDCWQYDATTDTWTQKINFPGAPRVYGVGFSIGANGYVGLGANGMVDFYKDFYEYDTAGNGSWTRVADFGGIARDGSSAFAVGGYGYVCFGQDSLLNRYQDMWEYNIGTNAWVQKTSYPGLPIYATGGFVIGANIYVGWGEDYLHVSDAKTWQYNTLLDSWSEYASIQQLRGFQGVAFAIADTGYYGFGDDSLGGVPNLFNRFFPDSSTGINTITGIDNKINMYPNPMNEQCLISLSIQNSVPEFRLFDLDGNKVEVSIKPMFSSYILYRGNLKAGEYILSIFCNNEVSYKKVIITN